MIARARVQDVSSLATFAHVCVGLGAGVAGDRSAIVALAFENHGTCLPTEVMVVVTAAFFHDWDALPEEAAPAIGDAVGPAAWDFIAISFALDRVGFAARVVAIARSHFPATALAICDLVRSTATPVV